MIRDERLPPILTIVTICWNNERGLTATLESVVAQDGARSLPFEVVIVDGGSVDGSVTTAGIFARQIPMRIFSEPDSGIYDAMNKGWQLATGKWIQYLNSGDVYADRACLGELIEELRHAEGAEWLVARTAFLDADGNVTRVSDTVPHKFWAHASGRRMHAHPSTLMTRTLIESLRGFSLNYGSAGDFDLVLRAGLRSTPWAWERILVRFELAGQSGDDVASVPELLHRIRLDRLAGKPWSRSIECVYSIVLAKAWRRKLKRHGDR